MFPDRYSVQNLFENVKTILIPLNLEFYSYNEQNLGHLSNSVEYFIRNKECTIITMKWCGSSRVYDIRILLFHSIIVDDNRNNSHPDFRSCGYSSSTVKEFG